MLLSTKKLSSAKNSDIYLSKKHIITQEQLSQLCSESKESRSSNLLQLVTRTKHKLNTISKRSNQPDPSTSVIKKPEPQLHPSQSLNQNKKENEELLKAKEWQEMNQLYEQNQKLGYRINYLTDQNNFYRISINNIEKLNNNIHKQLDGHDVPMVKNKINTKAVANSTHQSFNPQGGQKLTLNNSKSISTHAQGQALAGGNNGMGTIVHPLASGLIRKSTSKQMTPLTTGTSTPFEFQHTTPNNEAEQGAVKAQSCIGSSFSEISNKIHLKNLQMKVGNSIRKTQKLKKIYQGSISSLTKKAEQLQVEINKLSRQAEYYQIESQLLSNIYKADYYMHLNQDWFQVAACIMESTRDMNNMDGNQGESLGEISEEENEKYGSHDSDDDYAEYLKKGPQIIPKRKYNNQVMSAQHTPTSNKLTSSQHRNNNNHFRPETSISNKKNILMKEMNIESLPLAIRFLSGSHNQSHIGSNFKNSFYSALYNPKNKNNKLSELMIQNGSKQTLEINRLKRTRTSNNHGLGICQALFPSDPTLHPTTDRQSHQNENEHKHMTEKEIFLLPNDIIKMIISSLEKEEIHQLNKLESLRKEEREQRKKNYELIEGIEKLSVHKEKLKALIEQEFSLFFMNNINTMETISSFTNNNINPNSTKKATIINTGVDKQKQANDGKKTVIHSKNKARTLHRAPSAHKQSNSTATSPWISIQERKQEADQLYMCSLYEKQLLESIQKQDNLLQEQYKINQEYKQKIIDRNEQENKELKVLEEQVNKCMEQVKEIKFKYKSICQAKGKYIGSHTSMAISGSALPGKNIDYHHQA